GEGHHGSVPASVSTASGGRVAAAESVGYQTRPLRTTISEPALVPAAANVSRSPLHRRAPVRRSSSSRNAPTSATGIPASQIPSRCTGEGYADPAGPPLPVAACDSWRVRRPLVPTRGYATRVAPS